MASRASPPITEFRCDDRCVGSGAGSTAHRPAVPAPQVAPGGAGALADRGLRLGPRHRACKAGIRPIGTRPIDDSTVHIRPADAGPADAAGQAGSAGTITCPGGVLVVLVIPARPRLIPGSVSTATRFAAAVGGSGANSGRGLRAVGWVDVVGPGWAATGTGAAGCRAVGWVDVVGPGRHADHSWRAESICGASWWVDVT
jgi:hypothetical protein